MSASSTDEPVFQETEFVGEISINGETAPITLRASAGSDCRLQIRADNIDGHTYFLAVRNQGRPGESHEEFTLTGTSLDGKTISSAQIFVCGHGHDDDRRWIDLRSRACKITLPLEPRMFWKCSNRIARRSRLGRSSLRRASWITCPTIPRPSSRNGPSWISSSRSEGIVNLTRSSRPSWPLSLERGQPYRRAKDFCAPDRRATHGRRIPPLLKLTMPAGTIRRVPVGSPRRGRAGHNRCASCSGSRGRPRTSTR
jgi:hypothetical protein